jgi:hypothetical protein
MLILSKKKLYLARGFMWGGAAAAIVGILLSWLGPDSTLWDIVLLAAGLCVSISGAIALRRLFRCPNCKSSVLPDDSGIDLHTYNCPDHCPHCGAKIRME